ncbi:putative flippase GtrA (transmembrane translocase of bactoprenol-linked glucose) [Arthrobacter sp. VKM Ac-2550]|nr:putative flippase GtrA (transmembrane translocase of bactoprenol-linked glucose) [Arthrobacter sp. VKM Ac-2550]
MPIRRYPLRKRIPLKLMHKTMADRIRGLISLFWREVAKFGTVGGVAFVIDNGLYWWLINGPMSDSEVKARLVSASVATLFSWVANRYWTFRDRRQPNPVRELIMFVVINVIGMLISAGCVWIAKYPLDIEGRTELLIAGIFGTVVATVMRFFAYRFLVFNAELDAEPEFAHDHEIFEHEHVGVGHDRVEENGAGRASANGQSGDDQPRDSQARDGHVAGPGRRRPDSGSSS